MTDPLASSRRWAYWLIASWLGINAAGHYADPLRICPWHRSRSPADASFRSPPAADMVAAEKRLMSR